MYDPYLERGVRKKLLPEPNPTRVELPKNASLGTVFDKAKEIYFKDEPVDEDISYRLADSNGVTILIENVDEWTLWEFYQQNGLVPSRHKLYVMIVFGTVSQELLLQWSYKFAACLAGKASRKGGSV